MIQRRFLATLAFLAGVLAAPQHEQGLLSAAARAQTPKQMIEDRYGDTRPDGPSKAAPAPGPSEMAASDDLNDCMSVADVEDKDGDFKRNQAALSKPQFCIKQEIFNENGLRWVLQIVVDKKNPRKVFWVVPHDNEDDAFDSAVTGLQKHGGTMVAVETGGNRLNGRQDPNRNFSTGNARCRDQAAASPMYTSRVMRWWDKGTPIFALHTNERGYAGDGKGGAGGISMAKPPSGTLPFRAAKSIASKSPDDTLIFVASTEAADNDSNLKRFVDALHQENGINVLYEVVSNTRNDCSLSNYAALNGIRDYVNIEVVQTDGDAQRRMIDVVMRVMPPGGIGPVVKASGSNVATSPADSKPNAAPPATERVASAPAERPMEQDPGRQKKIGSSSVLIKLGSFNQKKVDQRDIDIRWSDLTKYEPLRDYRPVTRYSRESGTTGFFAGPFASEEEAAEFCAALTADRRKKGNAGGLCEVAKD